MMNSFLIHSNKNNFIKDLQDKSFMFEFFYPLNGRKYFVSTVLDKNEFIKSFDCEKIELIEREIDLNEVLEKIHLKGISLLTESERDFLDNYVDSL
jgi:hypothetical protein